MTQQNPQKHNPQEQQDQQGQNVHRNPGEQRQGGQQRQAEQSTGNNPGRQQGGRSDVMPGTTSVTPSSRAVGLPTSNPESHPGA